MHFIEQGGFAMYLILVTGGLALVSAARRAFGWGAVDEGTPLRLALLTFVIGVAGTASGLYTTYRLWTGGDIPENIARIGFMESLTPVMLAGGLTALALALDLIARTLLRRTGAPRV